MKTIIALTLALAAGTAVANMTCGLPPLPPLGCVMQCQCINGQCGWVAICR